MRRGWAILMVLSVACCAGCATENPVTSMSWLGRFRPLRGPVGPDVVQIDIYPVERAISDPYLAHEMWTSADEQVVSLERKAILEEYGFRVGQVGGLIPAGLQTLLTSERSCIKPNRWYLHAGRSTTLPVGPTMSACRFIIDQDGEEVPISFDQAECGFKVVPYIEKDGRIRLHFLPQIRHGETVMTPRAAEDGSGYGLFAEKPLKAFHNLAFDVTLDLNQLLIVGAHAARHDTLGHAWFVRPDEEQPVQRLLVIRACRASLAPQESIDEEADDDPSAKKIPTLSTLAPIANAQ